MFVDSVHRKDKMLEKSFHAISMLSFEYGITNSKNNALTLIGFSTNWNPGQNSVDIQFIFSASRFVPNGQMLHNRSCRDKYTTKIASRLQASPTHKFADEADELLT